MEYYIIIVILVIVAVWSILYSISANKKNRKITMDAIELDTKVLKSNERLISALDKLTEILSKQ